MENHPTLNVLFLCTHNSARSILAESILNQLGGGKEQQRFRGFSDGSNPRENQQPNPLALSVLKDADIPIEGLRSKSWDEFALPDAPRMDLVITQVLRVKPVRSRRGGRARAAQRPISPCL
jgi:arsenate reductase